MATSAQVFIRWMIRRDMPEVLRIEQVSHDFPWCEEDFLRRHRKRNCIGMIAEMGDKVVGFMIYELHETKLHLFNFAVSPELRRKSIGRRMAEKLISKLAHKRRTKILVDVRETNLVAQQFFRAVGFKATCVNRGFFGDSGEDGFHMVYNLMEVESFSDVMPANRVARFYQKEGAD